MPHHLPEQRCPFCKRDQPVLPSGRFQHHWKSGRVVCKGSNRPAPDDST